MENILNEDSVSNQTQILLVNAAYFVTNWMKKFPEAEIKECPFKVNKVCSEKKKKSTVTTQENANFELRKSQHEKMRNVYYYHGILRLCLNLYAVARVPKPVCLSCCFKTLLVLSHPSFKGPVWEQTVLLVYLDNRSWAQVIRSSHCLQGYAYSHG